MSEQPTPTRKAPSWLPVAIVIGLVVVVAAIVIISDAVNKPVSTASSSSPISVSADPVVLYEVEGTGSVKWADVTMETPTGTRQISPDVPMVRAMDHRPGIDYTFSPGAFVYISAQINDGYGTITCRISVGGITIAENTSSGSYAIASCKGTVP